MGFKWAFCGPMESQDLAGLQTTQAMVAQYLKRFIEYKRSSFILKRNGGKRTTWHPYE